MPHSEFHPWSSSQAKLSLEPFVELNKITANLLTEIAKHNLSAVNELAESTQAHWEDLAKVKGVNDILETQRKFISKVSPRALKHSEELLDCILHSANDYRNWFEHHLSHAKEEVKKATS